MYDVTSVRCLGNHQLWLRFDDGCEGIVDFTSFIEKGGIFAPLADPAFFAQVELHRDLGTVCWPNGADLCPDVLYSLATGKDLPSWAEEATARSGSIG